MKQGRTLPDLAAELQRQADAKRDFLAPAEALQVRSNGHTDLIVQGAYPLNEIAHGQLADYTGIPKAFYDRLRNATGELRVPLLHERYDPKESDYPLFDVLVNQLLWNKGSEGRLVRTLDGTTRAFLSQTFNPDLDNYDVLRVAAKVIEEHGLGPDNVVSCEVTERKLYLKVVSPKREAVIQPDNLTRPHGGHHFLKEPQVIQAGFIIINSEVGLGALSVQQIVVKLLCTNLFIQEEAFRQRHLGKALQADENGHLYRSDTRAADAKARLLKLRDQVADTLDEGRFLSLVGRMQETTGVRLDGKLERVMEVTARKFGLHESEKENVLQNLIEGADLSLWGLSNAITQTAQQVESYDRASELEAIGGRFFTLPTGELKEIVWAG